MQLLFDQHWTRGRVPMVLAILFAALELHGCLGREHEDDSSIASPAEARALRVVLEDLGLQVEVDDIGLCRVDGVHCESGRVIGLHFQGRGLQGSLAEDVTKLTALRSLSLSRNGIRGSLPRNLAQIAELRALWLDQNNLHGHLSAELCRLHFLQELSLSSNELSGELPACIGELRELRLLMLDRNAFTGVIPDSLFTLPHVGDLLIFRNQFESFTQMDWRGMEQLRVAMFFENPDLKGRLPVLPASIEKVDFRNCSLSGGLPKDWDLPHLRALYLAHGGAQLLADCQSWGGPPSCEDGRVVGNAHLPSLQVLDLSGLRLDCPVETLLGTFGRSPLSTLIVRASGLTGELDHHAFHTLYGGGSGCYHGPGTFYESITHLDLSGNSLNEVRWELFPFERPPPLLQVLSLENNRLQALDPEWLMPPFVRLVGNELLRSPLPFTADAEECRSFWDWRHELRPWNAEAVWNPCLRLPPDGPPDCTAGIDGYVDPAGGSSAGRKVWADPSFEEACAQPSTGSSSPMALKSKQDARTTVLRLGTAPLAKQIAQTAVDLGLMHKLMDTPQSCADLVHAIGLLDSVGAEDRVCRLMRALAALGLAVASSVTSFTASSATALLLDSCSTVDACSAGAEAQASFGPWLEYSPVFERYASALGEVITSGRSAPDILHGESGWGAIFNVNVTEAQLFERAFGTLDTREAILSVAPWPRGSFRMCDVGGREGDGSVLAAHRADISITILDPQPPNFDVQGSPGRLETRAHDMFEPLPPDLMGVCDVYWLNFVVQDFPDSQVESMLRHLRLGAKPSTRLFLANHALDFHSNTDPDLERFKREMDIWQMIAFGGKDRSVDEFRRLLFAAGWTMYQVLPVEGEASVICAEAGPMVELRPRPATMPGPWIGRVGLGSKPHTTLVISEDFDSRSANLVIVRAAEPAPEVLALEELPDMQFIGIWETLLPLENDSFMLLYCSKELQAPAARVVKLQVGGKLEWIGPPASFAERRTATNEHFFKDEDATSLLCAMRVTASATSATEAFVCFIREGADPGVVCRTIGIGSMGSPVWRSETVVHNAIMAAPCSNLPMHRFAALQVLLVGSAVLVLHSDGVLLRGGGRCDDNALHDRATCLEGSCELWSKVLRNTGHGFEVVSTAKAPLGVLHMLDVKGLEGNDFVGCYVAESRFPELSSEGRCSTASLVGGESVRWDVTQVFEPDRMSPPTADGNAGAVPQDLCMAGVPLEPSRFVVAYEMQREIRVVLGQADAAGLRLSFVSSEVLRAVQAQRPSVVSFGMSLLLVVADQASDNHPLLLQIPTNETVVLSP